MGCLVLPSDRRRFIPLALAMSLLLGAACAPDSGGDRRPGAPPETAETDRLTCSDGRDNDGDGLTDCQEASCLPLDVCLFADAGGVARVDAGGALLRDGSVAECAAIVAEASPSFAPVDIVWIIDSSGSMREEAEIVQNNINGFASAIGASGVDFRVVVITSSAFVTVPDPLGSDTARLRFLDEAVNSSESLTKLLARLDVYSDFLRPEAVQHFVVTTDDESELRWDRFRSDMLERLGKDFLFHAVASPDERHCMTVPFLGMICEPGCEGTFGDAADVGAEYYRLAEETGGETYSICESDWSPLFTRLQTSVVVSAAVPCFFELPPPPDGEAFDAGKVNVTFTGSGGAETTLPRALEPDRCEEAAAWFYDDNTTPTRIQLCPAACSIVEADEGGRVDVALGCETSMILI